VLDTKPVSVFIVDEFYLTVVATPLGITTDFECDPLVVLEAVAVFEYITDAKFERTSVFVPVEGVQVVPNEAVQLVAVVTSPLIPWWRRVLRHCPS